MDSPPSPPAPASTKIGLGCVTFGREIDRATSFAMLDHAAGQGVTFFDTAAAYGGGASETILGEWLAAHRSERDRLTVATKLLPPYSAARIELGVRESLARLQADRIDLLFLHQWHATALQNDVLTALAAQVHAGRVRALGVSNFSAVQLAELLLVQRQLATPPFAALQNVHNFATRGFDAATRDLCARAGLALVGYSPLGAGFLTGKHRGGVVPQSRFALIPGHQPQYLNESAQARLAQLERAAQESGLTLVQLALAWALGAQRVDTVLVGGRHCGHLDQAFAALRLKVDDVFARFGPE